VIFVEQQVSNISAILWH